MCMQKWEGRRALHTCVWSGKERIVYMHRRVHMCMHVHTCTSVHARLYEELAVGGSGLR